MFKCSKKIIVIALAFSGLVHGVFIFYYINDFSYGGVEEVSNFISVKLEAKNNRVEKVSSKKSNKLKKIDNHKSVVNDYHEVKSPSVKKEPEEIIEFSAIDESDEELDELDRGNDYQEKIVELAEAENRELLGEQKNLLLGLLHREINKHKNYPFMAIRQRREGLVKIKFMLYPDGQVSNIAIVKSSRYGLLDEAAKSAVMDASPFLIAENHLKKAELFNIDIDFRLN
ncbi:MAG: hypothetical protein DIZ80_16045 [endosymbiont of Galathealinum brachiosum]|uniref:TonB C-terminal domain-containing protein n=1 Tax=endosymbiont of Galathealinum brachiosum TaxID=2200906 RepID=A0A370DB33_9GAMM|nr:MAG: hypothetical protein DIZ80_16045 [endosymbiont of Galathealinum brachiosum]